MRIPNKFNGYSADNRRIYNNPALVVATIANMGEGVAVANALAAAAATATAAETAAAATAAETAATQAAAQQAGQAGIMQGAAVPPPGVTPPGVPGLGAPMPPATPPAPAGVNSMGVPDVTSSGINPAGQDQAIKAFQDAQATPINAPQYGEKLAGPASPFEPRTVNPADYSEGLGKSTLGEPAAKAAADGAAKTGNSLLDGFNLVKKFAGEAYEGFRQAPPAVQYVSAGLTAKKFLMDEPEGPKKEEYKRTPYAGLSPNFASTESGEYRQPGGTSPYLYGFADGGITGPVEQMSNMNAIGGNTMYPMANIPRLEYANPVQQRPVSENIMTMGGDSPTDPYTGQLKFNEGGYAEEKEAKENAEQRKRYSQMMGNTATSPEESLATGQSIASRAHGKSASITGHGIVPRSRAQSLSSPNSAAQTEMAAMMKKYGIKATMPKTLDPQSGSAGAGESDYASGGITYGLGGYSDGGRLLKGPGDGVSDSIPATIGSKQPARLADGEFVIPARIVSELGNGSTEAGARQLYAMMERIQKGRKKSVGKGKVAVNSKAAKHLPA